MTRLAVHEEDQHTVIFKEGHAAEAVEEKRDTTLTAWFKRNQTDPDAAHLKYPDFPEHYTYDTSKRCWNKRKRGICIGRLYTTTPAQGEHHYLRILLHHIAGAKSFDDLKRGPDGQTFPTFKETALAMGLLKDDDESNRCLAEATHMAFPTQIRKLFVIILIYCEPNRPRELWEKHKDAMAEDILHKQRQIHGNPSLEVNNYIYNEVLIILQEELEKMHSSLEKYDGIPQPEYDGRILNEPRVIQEEIFPTDLQSSIAEAKLKCLNNSQHQIYNEVMKAVDDREHKTRLFFINGPGGFGKTFLFETLLAAVRSQGKIALAVASSGIAAELLEGGRTAHSRFKIPIPITETSVCNITAQSKHAELLRRTSLIIWDECLMSHRHQIESVDRSMQDLLKSDQRFGGICTVFGGDPRQILPVVRHGTRAHIVHVCVMSSPLWAGVQEMKLSTNMRVDPEELEFSEYVLGIGNGTEKTYPDRGESIIKIPDKYLVPTVNHLINQVYPDFSMAYNDRFFVAHRAILTPKNENVDDLNNTIMNMFPGTSKTYLSIDGVLDGDDPHIWPVEYLNSITPSGMPPHELTLKKGSPIMLLRNLSPGAGHGLCNGTRLIITQLGNNVLEGEIATGNLIGNRVLIPRISLAPSDVDIPFRRHQFPVKPCFVMTINKSQGQTLNHVGIYLPEHVFSHGQLYVAFSRAKRPSTISVYLGNPEGYTSNIVYNEVL